MASSPHPSPTSTHSLDQGWPKSSTGVGMTSFRTSTTSTSESKSHKSFWSSLAKRAKAALIDDGMSTQVSSDTGFGHRDQFPETSLKSDAKFGDAKTGEGKPRREDAPVFQKSFEAIASSFSVLSGTIGNALEEGLNLVETKASDLISSESRLKSMKKQVDTPKADQQHVNYVQNFAPGTDIDTQLKASRDVAMAMSAKAKLLLRELKTVKTDLIFAKERCMQLEEENKRLRESLRNGIRHDEEDLVRIQLETLLAEKARLLQENAYYARENQFLREVVEYHRLTMQDVVVLDESIVEAAEMLIEPDVEEERVVQPAERVVSMISV